MNILIIEDDTRIAELIQRGLQEQGFVPTLAYDGLSGKKLALQNDYNLIITDIDKRIAKTKKPGTPQVFLFCGIVVVFTFVNHPILL